MIGMRPGRLVGVVLGIQIVGARKMGVMAGGFVIAAGRVPGGFAMVMSGALVMLGGMFVMFGGAFGVSHCRLLIFARVLRSPPISAIVRQTSDAPLRKPHEPSVTPR
jgi:hypothetical protein